MNRLRERAARLQAFLGRFEGKPVTWGVDDCSAAPVLWVREETGIDIDLPAYSSREEAQALIAEAGGLVRLWEARQASIRERHDMPVVGDVGIINTRLFGPVGVICGSPGVALWRRETGGWYPIAPRAYLKVWALP